MHFRLFLRDGTHGVKGVDLGSLLGARGRCKPPRKPSMFKKKNGNQRGKRYTIADIEGFHTRQKSGGTFPGGGGPIPTD